MLEKIIDWLDKKLFESKSSTKKTITFPSKRTQDPSACFGVLALYGAAFCLDNYNIIFKDFEGKIKVIKPVRVEEELNPHKNLEVDRNEDGFFVKYEGRIYYYYADITVTFDNGIMFKIRNVRQSVYPTRLITLDEENENKRKDT